MDSVLSKDLSACDLVQCSAATVSVAVTVQQDCVKESETDTDHVCLPVCLLLSPADRMLACACMRGESE